MFRLSTGSCRCGSHPFSRLSRVPRVSLSLSLSRVSRVSRVSLSLASLASVSPFLLLSLARASLYFLSYALVFWSNLPSLKNGATESLENALGMFWQFLLATNDFREAQLQLLRMKTKPDSATENVSHLASLLPEYSKVLERVYREFAKLGSHEGGEDDGEGAAGSICEAIEAFVHYDAKVLPHRKKRCGG